MAQLRLTPRAEEKVPWRRASSKITTFEGSIDRSGFLPPEKGLKIIKTLSTLA